MVDRLIDRFSLQQNMKTLSKLAKTTKKRENEGISELIHLQILSIDVLYRTSNMPNNRQHAIKRAMWIKHKFKDSKYHEDYVDFMNKIITQGYAAKVPESQLDVEEGKVWYLPHHGVYHPRNPEKIRVVFDCSRI